MQKIINVLAIASTIVSATVVGGGVYVYVNRASIIDGVKSKVMESVIPDVGLDIPSSPMPEGTGFGIPSF